MRRPATIMLGVVLFAGLVLSAQRAYGDSSTITVAEDTYVSQGNPSATHGGYGYLATNAAPGERRVHVKVTVNGIPTGATGVTSTLRLWGQTASSSVFTVRQVPSTWTEGSLTWNNQPALGTTVTTRTGVASGQYNTFNVTNYITGNGTYAMAVTTITTTQIKFTSKESTANHPPQLLVSWTPPTTTTSTTTTSTSTSTTTTTPPADDPVVAGAGDIACAPPATRTSSACHQADTANLLAAGGYDAVLPLGDQQYECGQLSAFQAVYDPTWGRFKSISHPATGDNEYVGSGCSTPGASGHFTYFGGPASPDQPSCLSACPGYYSYNLGSWHVVVLNTECTQPGVGGCGSTSAQGQWLAADLAAHPTQCTLAYWHKPRWNDAGGVSSSSSYFVQALYNAHAEVILTGHNHYYERFAPQTPSGAADPANGIRQFIVGTGGKSLHGLSSTPPANAEARNSTTFGILKLTLHPGSYDWRFVPEAGKTFTDSGIQSCH
jgi:hypothetical protein